MPLLGSRGAASTTGFGGLTKFGYLLRNSLRFRSSASAYLNRTPSTTTNRQIWTWSAWVKQGSALNSIFSTNASDNNSYNYFGFDSNAFRLYQWNGSSYDFQFITTPVYRDPSAWYHFVIQVDTTQSTAANRVRFYVNGVQVTAFSTNTTPSQNLNTYVNNSSYSHLLCRNPAGSSTYFDGYLAEINFIDGQALTPSSFGKTDAGTGQWVPIKYTGTYGTNGFYLPFTNTTSTSTLGNDFSGNGNTWTVNNISLTAGATYDSMTDVPTLTNATTANYCVLNPLNIVSPSTISGGNLNFDTGTTGGGGVYANWNYPESGKFYHELSNLSGVGTANGRASAANVYWESNTGDVYISSVFVANVGTWNDTSTLGFAADCGAKTIALYRNNVLLYTANAGNAMFSSPVAYAADGSGSFAISGSFNFGQRPFTYTPPSGFKALNTYNLP